MTEALVDQTCIRCGWPFARRRWTLLTMDGIPFEHVETRCGNCGLEHPCAAWKGAMRRRWIWRRWRFEWGRYCYRTDAMGNTLRCWWEPESDSSTGDK